MGEKIIIVSYDPNWKILFEEEKKMIRNIVGDHIEDIRHIGSTSVEGLAAKPIIDILIGIRSLADARECVSPLGTLGYEYVPEYEKDLPMRRYFRKPVNGTRTHHIHMVELTSHFWKIHLAFRDYLAAHRKERDEYAALKRVLAEKYPDDREAYTNAKTDFINGIVSLTLG
jgi:GrpB-like predicted nucleotidyltransferase (UPF0157 family)